MAQDLSCFDLSRALIHVTSQSSWMLSAPSSIKETKAVCIRLSSFVPSSFVQLFHRFPDSKKPIGAHGDIPSRPAACVRSPALHLVLRPAAWGRSPRPEACGRSPGNFFAATRPRSSHHRVCDGHVRTRGATACPNQRTRGLEVGSSHCLIILRIFWRLICRHCRVEPRRPHQDRPSVCDKRDRWP